MAVGPHKIEYEVIKGWEQMPDGWSFFEVAGVACDSKDHVYVFNRGKYPMIIFDKEGKFLRNIWIRTGTPKLPDPRGTVWWVAFSRDPQEKYLYVMNGRNEVVTIVENESGKILSTFGRPGHQIGDFTHGHTIAVDSKGNIYVAETDTGRRVQRFKPVN